MKNWIFLFLVGCSTNPHLIEENSIDSQLDTIHAMCQSHMSEFCWQQYHRLLRQKVNRH